MMPPVLFFFLKITLAIQGLLWIHTNFRIICSISVEYAIGILVGIASILCISLGSTDILTMYRYFILPIHEHKISFHLFMFLNVFHQCLTVFSTQNFHLLGLIYY